MDKKTRIGRDPLKWIKKTEGERSKQDKQSLQSLQSYTSYRVNRYYKVNLKSRKGSGKALHGLPS